MNFARRYWLRSFVRTHAQAKSVLAMACLALSLAMLTLALGLQAGTRASVAAIMEQTGNRNLTINAATVRGLPNRGSAVSGATTLTLQDYEALKLQAQHRSRRTAAVSAAARRAEFRELAMTVNVTGTQAAYFALQHFELAQGRLLDTMDEERSTRVSVLGAQVAEQLFGNYQESVLAPEAMIGQHIRIAGVPFEVVGVLRPRGNSQTGLPQDDRVYVPLPVAMKQVFDVDYLNTIVLETADLAVIPQLREQLTALLRHRHRLRETAAADFTLLDATAALEASERSQFLTAGFFRGLAVLLLGLSAMGLFAVNHLSVKTRKYEFGLRRAVGATRINILLQVVSESLLLGIASGFAGAMLGLAACAVLDLWTDWALGVDGWIIVQVALAAITTSLLASVLPALQAALRYPVQALNRE